MISVSSHSGLTGTERQQSIGIGGRLAGWLASPVAKGCRPQLMAATSAHVKPGSLYGPRLGIWGAPTLQKIDPKIVTSNLANKLWEYSEQITGIKFS